MKDLIEALTILAKYADPQDRYPTHCEHDVLYVKGPSRQKIREDDAKRIHALSFSWDIDTGMWRSIRFGSC